MYIDSFLDDYDPITEVIFIHIFGKPDCGKTSICKDIIESNRYKSFIYINKNLDNLNKMKKYSNCVVFSTNIFEITFLVRDKCRCF